MQYQKSVNIQQLKALDAVASHGSCLQAAKALAVTQLAVSIMLCRLQDEHGFKLFIRWGKQAEFSVLGQAPAEKARKILRLLDDFKETISAANCLQTGKLEIGLSCHYFVMDMLAIFMERYPDVKIRAQVGDSRALVEDILKCRLDLAEVTAAKPDKRLFNLAYNNQDIVLFVAKNHPWADLKTLPVEKFDGRPMVARHSTSMTPVPLNRTVSCQEYHASAIQR